MESSRYLYVALLFTLLLSPSLPVLFTCTYVCVHVRDCAPYAVCVCELLLDPSSALLRSAFWLVRRGIIDSVLTNRQSDKCVLLFKKYCSSLLSGFAFNSLWMLIWSSLLTSPIPVSMFYIFNTFCSSVIGLQSLVFFSSFFALFKSDLILMLFLNLISIMDCDFHV